MDSKREALDYNEPLSSPICVVQSSLVSINNPEMHDYIQRKNKDVMEDTYEEGAHDALLLTTLDFSKLIMVMTTITEN